MKSKLPVLAFAGLAFLFLAGCAHYAVTDLVSGNTYYTDDIDSAGNGSIKFQDAKTGKEVTLQSSEIKEIDKEDYNLGVYGVAKPD